MSRAGIPNVAVGVAALMSAALMSAALMSAALLCGCVGGNGTSAASVAPAAPQNTLTLTVDAGPPASPGGAPVGAINHAYVTVKVCASGSKTECANIDHVLLDTGSVGLRLVRSVLAAQAVALTAQTDAQGRTIEECVSFTGGQTWGAVALADVTMAGEIALKLPVQVMDDRAAPSPAPPAGCGANGTLINGVSGFNANGVLGVGVLAQDCGAMCVTGGADPDLLRLHRRRSVHRRDHRGSRGAGRQSGDAVRRRQQRRHRQSAEPQERQRGCDGAGRVDIRHRHPDEQWPARDGADRARRGCERRLQGDL